MVEVGRKECLRRFLAVVVLLVAIGTIAVAHMTIDTPQNGSNSCFPNDPSQGVLRPNSDVLPSICNSQPPQGSTDLALVDTGVVVLAGLLEFALWKPNAALRLGSALIYLPALAAGLLLVAGFGYGDGNWVGGWMFFGIIGLLLGLAIILLTSIALLETGTNSAAPMRRLLPGLHISAVGMVIIFVLLICLAANALFGVDSGLVTGTVS